MTVQELIDELQKVEDKKKEIFFFHKSYEAWETINNVSEFSATVVINEEKP